MVDECKIVFRKNPPKPFLVLCETLKITLKWTGGMFPYKIFPPVIMACFYKQTQDVTISGSGSLLTLQIS